MKIIGMKKIVMKKIDMKKPNIKKIGMKSTFISRTTIAALLILLGISATPAYAAVAGRVLVSVGDSVAIRNGQEVRLRHGSHIEDKDTLRTSAAGTLQVRFTDQSIVALREKSTFKLEQYAFSKETGGAQTAVFNLIKGGFRTITGLIGKSNQRGYSVKTAAATIGIRGTHYAVRVCEDDCTNPDGSNAKDGVYGSVLSASDKDSRIIINNNSGENEFGRNEHFYVKDDKTAPQTLLVPPTFIADNLKGRGQIADKDQQDDDKDTDGKSGKDDKGRDQKTAREAGEDKGRHVAKGGSDDDPRPNMVKDTFDKDIDVADPNCTTGDCRNLPPPPLQRGSVVVTGKAGWVAGFLPASGVFTTPLSTSNAALFPAKNQLTFNSSGDLVNIQQISSGDGTTQVTYDIGSAYNARKGHNTNAGNLAWGAWIGSGITATINDLSVTPLDSLVYIHGDATYMLPNRITATYTPIGGIALDRNGNMGKITDGNISVDFLARLVSLNSLEVIMSDRYFTYSSNPQLLPFISSDGSFSDGGTAACFGVCSQALYNFSASGAFTGAGAQGIGLNYSLIDDIAADQIMGVEGFLRTDSVTFRPVINASNFGVAGGLATTTVSGSGGSEKLLSFTAPTAPTPFLFNLVSGVETDLFPITGPPLPAITDMIGGLAAINAHWGRWVNGALDDGFGFLTTGTGVHYIYGFDLTTPSVVAARTGIFNFTHVGGTTPTDDQGHIASASSFGSMLVNFQNQDGVMSPMSWTINDGSDDVTHNINNVNLLLIPDAQLGIVTINGFNFDGTCTGGVACGQGSAGVFTEVTGAFAGASGNYAALSIATQSIAGSTASAQVYQCANCGSTAGITPAGALVAYAGGAGLATYANTDNPLFILPTDKTLGVGGTLLAYNTLFGDSASLGSGTTVPSGTVGPAGDHFGRWDGGSITGNNDADVSLPATPFTPESGIHVIYSAALTLPEVIAARIGSANFNRVSGTNPTDHTGGVGTFNSGNLNVDFDLHTATMDANWSVTPVGGTAVTYALNGTPLTLFVDGSGASIHSNLLSANDVSTFCSACSDPNGTIDKVNIQGNFSGAAGNTINMAISTFDAGISVIPVTSASVQVFQEVLPIIPQ